MSGGSLNYFYSDLESHAGDFGDIELDALVQDLAKLFHDREWYLSCDTCEGDWNEARDAFKAKWFSQNNRTGVVREIVEEYLANLRREVFSKCGLLTDYCKDCSNWTPENTGHSDDEYGRCVFKSGCLMHRCESCEKFTKKEDEQ